MRVTTNLDSLNPSVSRADFFILRGTCKTGCYIIKKKKGRSRFQCPKMCDFLNLIVSSMMATMDTVEDMYSLFNK